MLIYQFHNPLSSAEKLKKDSEKLTNLILHNKGKHHLQNNNKSYLTPEWHLYKSKIIKYLILVSENKLCKYYTNN